MVIECSIMEEKNQAALEVIQNGVFILEVVNRFDVARQRVRSWFLYFE